MRIVMMGTGPFALPTFRALLASEHELLCLVTRPDAGSRKSRNKIINPMRDAAVDGGLSVFDPPSVNHPAFVEQLSQLAADLFVVCDYGQILSKACLATARLGGINLHGSLLPKYRGAAPVNWAIYNGDSKTGVTVIHMTAKLDGGPIIAQLVIPIDPAETASDLELRMAEAGAPTVVDSIEMLDNWDGEQTIGSMQDKTRISKAPRLTKIDGRVDWQRSAKQIYDQIRAFKPWPGTYTNWNKSADQVTRLIIHQAVVIDQTPKQPSGCVEQVDDQQLLVACHSSLLGIHEVQPAGKRAMNIADFLRGNAVGVGDELSGG